jgi:teichuronic acid biosynthesis protein TuaE
MSAGQQVETVPPARRCRPAADGALVGGAVLATAGLALLFARKPLAGTIGMLVVAAVFAVIVICRMVAHVAVRRLLLAGLLILPLAAIIGPSASLPGLRQLFAFRLIVAIVAAGGLTWLLLTRAHLRVPGGQFVALILLWFAWLVVTFVWAPDKGTGVRYMVDMVLMLALTIGVCLGGSSRARLRLVWRILAITFYVVLAGAVIEIATGIHMPASRLISLDNPNPGAVTSFFHNENDLGVFLAMCWPFLLAGFFADRRLKQRVIVVVTGVVTLAVFVRTGARLGFMAFALETFAYAVYFGLLRLDSRRKRITAGVAALAVVVAGAWLLFNSSQSALLGQFQVTSVLSNVKYNYGSGAIRLFLLHKGYQASVHYWFLGAGPGQAEGLMLAGPNPALIPNMHNWWLELLVNGGLPALFLQVMLFVSLALGVWRVLRRPPDAFLGFLATGAFFSFVGFIVGSIGPSSVHNFPPMWILWGLAIAVIARARAATPTGDVEEGARP